MTFNIEEVEEVHTKPVLEYLNSPKDVWTEILERRWKKCLGSNKDRERKNQNRSRIERRWSIEKATEIIKENINEIVEEYNKKERNGIILN